MTSTSLTRMAWWQKLPLCFLIRFLSNLETSGGPIILARSMKVWIIHSCHLPFPSKILTFLPAKIADITNNVKG